MCFIEYYLFYGWYFFLHFCQLLPFHIFPDVHYHINSMAPYSDYGFLFHKIGGFREDWCNDYYTSHYAKDAATILPVILLPKSCERLWLQSTDPFELSYIDPKYYIHPDKCQHEDCWNQK